jgi:hypothetical protein
MSARNLFLVASLIALSAGSAPLAYAQQKTPPQNPNPTGDRDVQAGYDRTTQEIKDRRAQEGTLNGTSTGTGGRDRVEHDRGHNDCPSPNVCSVDSTYKSPPTPPPESD